MFTISPSCEIRQNVNGAVRRVSNASSPAVERNKRSGAAATDRSCCGSKTARSAVAKSNRELEGSSVRSSSHQPRGALRAPVSCKESRNPNASLLVSVAEGQSKIAIEPLGVMSSILSGVTNVAPATGGAVDNNLVEPLLTSPKRKIGGSVDHATTRLPAGEIAAPANRNSVGSGSTRI